MTLVVPKKNAMIVRRSATKNRTHTFACNESKERGRARERAREIAYVWRCETYSFQVVAYSSIRIPVFIFGTNTTAFSHTKCCKNEIKNKINRRNDQSTKSSWVCVCVCVCKSCIRMSFSAQWGSPK